MGYGHRDILHPSNPSTGESVRWGDYPVALMTRRTLGQRTAEVLEQRSSSPGQIRLSQRSRYSIPYER